MKKSGLIILSMMVFAGMMVLGATTQSATATGEHDEIVIGVIEGQNKFNVTSINVSPGVTYTIIFQNTDLLVGHNFRIDDDSDVSASKINDADDTVIGDENDVGGKGDQTWTLEWTAPDEDIDITYFCGYAGHYSGGMEGKFIVGAGGEPVPVLGLFLSLFSLFILALAVPRMRKN